MSPDLFLQQVALTGVRLAVLSLSVLLFLLLLLFLAELLDALELLLHAGRLDRHQVLDLVRLDLASALLLDLNGQLQFDLLRNSSRGPDLLDLSLNLGRYLTLDVRDDLLLEPGDVEELRGELDLGLDFGYCGLSHLSYGEGGDLRKRGGDRHLRHLHGRYGRGDRCCEMGQGLRLRAELCGRAGLRRGDGLGNGGGLGSGGYLRLHDGKRGWRWGLWSRLNC